MGPALSIPRPGAPHPPLPHRKTRARFRAVPRRILGILILVALIHAPARSREHAQDDPEAPAPPVAEAPPAPPGGGGEDTVAAPPFDPFAPLEPAERDTLLRLAWHTLVGHLTRRPIQDADLPAYDLTPRLLAPRGCWVTVRKDGAVRGSQGEIEPSRPLYQQVIVFVRRAATRDPRFVPLTDLDLGSAGLEIAVIGRREPVDGPEAIDVEGHGVFLEKWGRRAMFLPGVAAAQGWDARRTLEELCRSASLPAGAWSSGARLEVFSAEIVSGTRPEGIPPPAAPPEAAPGPAPGEATPAEPPAGAP